MTPPMTPTDCPTWCDLAKDHDLDPDPVLGHVRRFHFGAGSVGGLRVELAQFETVQRGRVRRGAVVVSVPRVPAPAPAMVRVGA